MSDKESIEKALQALNRIDVFIKRFILVADMREKAIQDVKDIHDALTRAKDR